MGGGREAWAWHPLFHDQGLQVCNAALALAVHTCIMIVTGRRPGQPACSLTAPLAGRDACRYDGVWCNGIAKAGSYSEVAPAPPGAPGALPNLELAEPAAVLAGAAADVLGGGGGCGGAAQ